MNAFPDHLFPFSMGINASEEGAIVGTQYFTGGVNFLLVEWLGMWVPL